MKKISSLILVCALAASSFTAAAAANTSFSDINEERLAWAKPSIEEMVEMGFIKGYEDGSFRPDNSVTRLETIALFARAMGVESENNAEVLKTAVEKYSDLVEGYKLNFGEDEVCFMLYRGALTEEDLDTYLKGSRASEAMPRHEAAIIMTKAMGAEERAKKELMVDLDYSDALEIPQKSTQYVYYATENGLMNGMGNNEFSPLTSILRSQMAVMLSRTVEKMGIGFEEVYLASYNAASNNITIRDESDDKYVVGANEYTRVYKNGSVISISDMPLNVYASFTYVNNELLYVDIHEQEDTVSEKYIFQGYTSNEGNLSITLKKPGSDTNTVYKLADSVEYSKPGKESVINSFTAGDYVEVTLLNGRVIKLYAIDKTQTVKNAVVDEIAIEDDVCITISHSDDEYDGMKLTVPETAVVYKNNDTSDLSKIYKGDSVNITLEYGIVSKLVASSSLNVYEGTIQEIHISAAPSIIVRINGADKEYDLSNDVQIIIDGEDGNLYDFKVGNVVKVTTESGVITKITSTASQQTSSKSITGTITAINSSYGFIKLSCVDSTGYTYEETVYCKDGTTTIINSKGSDKFMKNLSVGDVISVRGSVSNGAFNASLVIIED